MSNKLALKEIFIYVYVYDFIKCYIKSIITCRTCVKKYVCRYSDINHFAIK